MDTIFRLKLTIKDVHHNSVSWYPENDGHATMTFALDQLVEWGRTGKLMDLVCTAAGKYYGKETGFLLAVSIEEIDTDTL